jgi:5-methyltetrahydrofolate--homocysteine methyltransferase
MEENNRFGIEALRGRVLRLDGAMGTQIQGFQLTEADFRKGLTVEPARDVKGDNECLNLSRPDVVRAIHQAYVDAGADIIETNGFGANALVQQDYGLAALAPRMALEAARLAREVADAAPRKVWVAGNMGPTSKSLSLVSDFLRPEWRPCSFDEMAAAYEEQARAFIEGGVDLILVETCFDALNAKAALYAVEQACPGFPVIVSVSVSNAFGRTLTGQSLEAFCTAVDRPSLVAFGLNCSMGADGLVPLVREMAQWCPVPIICYPNAGLPNAQGEYDETPETMAGHVAGLDGLVNIVGGCCGTTPSHIKALPELTPRPIPASGNELKVSGLEAWTVSDPSDYVAPDFKDLISREEYDEALMLAGEKVMEGAPVLAVNLDGLDDVPAQMERFVRLIQGDPSVSCAALMIESDDWDALLQGLKNAQGKCIARALDPKGAAFGEKAAVLRSLGAAIVVRVEGEAEAAKVVGELAGAGIPPEDIILERDRTLCLSAR